MVALYACGFMIFSTAQCFTPFPRSDELRTQPLTCASNTDSSCPAGHFHSRHHHLYIRPNNAANGFAIFIQHEKTGNIYPIHSDTIAIVINEVRVHMRRMPDDVL